MSGIFYGVGIGPGDPRYLTVRAVEVLQQVDVLFTVISQNAEASVSQAVVESLHPRGEIRLQTFSMSRDTAVRQAQVVANAAAIIRELQTGKNCAFATLGDPLTYSTFGYILPLVRDALPGLEVEIVPGITSFATLAARAGEILVENGEQLHIVPSFRTEKVGTMSFPKGSTTILLKTYRSRQALLARLAQEPDLTILYGERLTMEGEHLERDLEGIRGLPEQYLSMIMVKKP